MNGTVYLVGAGPGAADLLTLRAARLLEQANIVFHDALVHADTLALATKAEKIAVGKRCGKHSTVQKFINKRLIDAARKHKIVVRLKGGDPMLFGRAQEEIDALSAACIAFEVVPGITSALAASAQIGVSLTRRGLSRNVAFVTPRVGETEHASDWVAGALAADSVAIYMGAGQAETISAALIARGRDPGTPIALVESASLPQAAVRYGTLRALPALAAESGKGPVVILLGEVLREKLEAQLALARRQLLATA